MKIKLENQEKQDKEVSAWWNSEKTKKWHDLYYDKANHLSSHVILRQVKILKFLKELNLPPNSKILELGCGGGQTALKICQMGFKYVGIDISKHLCDETERKIKKYIDLGKAKILNQSIEKKYPFKDSEFDACVVIGASQYVGNLEFYFNEINRTLKKNCCLLISQANMHPLLDITKPRRLIRQFIYLIGDQDILISPSFNSMLLKTKFKKYFSKFENSNFMNSKFMTKGEENLKFAIRKRLYSASSLKKILEIYNFNVIKMTGATFFSPKKNIFFYFWFIFDLILQKLLDYKILPFLKNVSDNLVFVAKKNEYCNYTCKNWISKISKKKYKVIFRQTNYLLCNITSKKK